MLCSTFFLLGFTHKSLLPSSIQQAHSYWRASKLAGPAHHLKSQSWHDRTRLPCLRGGKKRTCLTRRQPPCVRIFLGYAMWRGTAASTRPRHALNMSCTLSLKEASGVWRRRKPRLASGGVFPCGSDWVNGMRAVDAENTGPRLALKALPLLTHTGSRENYMYLCIILQVRRAS
jgi:hypothetical protein